MGDVVIGQDESEPATGLTRPRRDCEECSRDISGHSANARYCGDRCSGRAGARRRKALATNTAAGLKLRQAVFDRYGWTCHLCGKGIPFLGDPMLPDGPTVDHVTPLSRGGTDVITNLRPAHMACNRNKGVG